MMALSSLPRSGRRGAIDSNWQMRSNGLVPVRKANRASRIRSAEREGASTVASGPVFTIDDLVVYLKLPKSTVYKLAQEGKIPGQKVGRHWRFHRVTIDQWLRNDSTTRDSKEKS